MRFNASSYFLMVVGARARPVLCDVCGILIFR